MLKDDIYGRVKKALETILESDAKLTKASLAKELGCSDPGSMFMKMWIFIHGAACMTLSGDYDLTDEETMSLLEKAYNSFLV